MIARVQSKGVSWRELINGMSGANSVTEKMDPPGYTARLLLLLHPTAAFLAFHSFFHWPLVTIIVAYWQKPFLIFFFVSLKLRKVSAKNRISPWLFWLMALSWHLASFSHNYNPNNKYQMPQMSAQGSLELRLFFTPPHAVFFPL